MTDVRRGLIIVNTGPGKGKTTAAKTPPTPPARDVPKKVTIGPLEKALRAAEAQK